MSEPLCQCGHPEESHGDWNWPVKCLFGSCDCTVSGAELRVRWSSPPARSATKPKAIPGIDPNVWEVVDTHAGRRYSPATHPGLVGGHFHPFRRAARLAGKDDENA